MKYGVFYFPTHYGMDVAELAIALEERGFESLFLCEHTHIPAERRTPFPSGGDLPKKYWHTHDPFVSLSFAAAATKSLRLGTGICLMPQRDPIVTAKVISSLDIMSGGRIEFAVGAGWNVEEMENHGVVHKARFRNMTEKLKAMQAMWTEEEASFHGDHVNFDRIVSSPKPLQQPHPPILLGGETDHTIRRAVEFANGWFPRANFAFDPVEGMARLKNIADEAGRSLSELPVTVFRAPPEADKLPSYAAAGIHRVLFDVPDATRDEVLPLLDEYAALIS
jgi:probable F420-dependent oxidoreductase